jgi:hypothetical protein
MIYVDNRNLFIHFLLDLTLILKMGLLMNSKEYLYFTKNFKNLYYFKKIINELNKK